ncbi:hypothetical protein SASPL_136140 [Salvia splendens]|uniref:UBA domain-containing protein n=1 Tax=Salvia splendens TaxID=180675 RepID=A0A8X8X1K6_SALSN|nr:hypothetical protein SASPL_136140 [Salvia splendens]
MRPNVVSEAGLSTRVNQWWEAIPFLTSVIVAICGAIYLVCLLVGYDSFVEVCFLPSAVISHFQVYRTFTSIVFHGSMLHVLFNMMALVPMGTELERIMGSIRLLYIIILLAISSAILHLVIALLAAYNPISFYPALMHQCSIGFSGILFFGLFNVPAKCFLNTSRYVWILLVVFQLLMANVSLLGHLCGILSGYAYTFGFFDVLIPGGSFYSSIEESSLLSACVRRPKFILSTGSNVSGHIPTYTSQNTAASGLLSGNMWRNLSSWMPQRESSVEVVHALNLKAMSVINTIRNKDSNESNDYTLYNAYWMQTAQGSDRFPGRGRTLGSETNRAASVANSDSNLQARLLDDVDDRDQQTTPSRGGGGQPMPDGRPPVVNSAVQPARTQNNQGSVATEEEIQKLVAMGFDRTQVEVAIAAADRDLNVAAEILMSQQG